MILAIDVGNTLTKFGLHDGEGWTLVERCPTPLVIEEVSRSPLSGLAGQAQVVVGCSVVPDAARALESRVPVRWLTAQNVGIPIRYGPPWSVGADRLANALALRELARPAIALDIGSATTFDVVDRDGAFAGGAILPGPALWLKSLAQGTAQLPEGAMDQPASALGASTLHGLQSGLYFGMLGALERLAAELADELQQSETRETTLLAITGGYARLVEAALGESDVLRAHAVVLQSVPHLTLDGLVCFHRLGF
ncbi:MAG: type III pantothenate kinase [Chthonomonas sp.]